MPQIEIKPGSRFGRLTVLNRLKDRTDAAFACRCECSQIRIVRMFFLKNGTVTACAKCSHLEKKYAAEIAEAKRIAFLSGRHAIDVDELPKRESFQFEGNEDALATAQEADSQ